MPRKKKAAKQGFARITEDDISVLNRTINLLGGVDPGRYVGRIGLDKQAVVLNLEEVQEFLQTIVDAEL